MREEEMTGGGGAPEAGGLIRTRSLDSVLESGMGRMLARKRYQEKNKESLSAYHKAWREKNKERLKEYRAKHRKANRAKVKGEFLIDLMARQGGRCALCGDGLVSKHLDHVVPRSRGGEDEEGNYRWLCPTCNTCKGALLDDEFILHIRKILAFRA